ncbi:siderophore-interacting protein [Brevibacterium casei]|nr:siderophore-interacting protein [Brevibacterium casei]
MVTWPSGIRRLRHRTDREVVVTRVEDFSDRYRRIHFTGDDLLHDLTDVYPTAWVRLWVPESPAGVDDRVGDGSAKAGNGDAATTDHPGPARGSGRVSRRDYTFVDVDIRSGSFALDLVLPHHRTAGEAAFGPATRWALAAGNGDRRLRHPGPPRSAEGYEAPHPPRRPQHRAGGELMAVMDSR